MTGLSGSSPRVKQPNSLQLQRKGSAFRRGGCDFGRQRRHQSQFDELLTPFKPNGLVAKQVQIGDFLHRLRVPLVLPRIVPVLFTLGFKARGFGEILELLEVQGDARHVAKHGAMDHVHTATDRAASDMLYEVVLAQDVPGAKHSVPNAPSQAPSSRIRRCPTSKKGQASRKPWPGT